MTSPCQNHSAFAKLARLFHVDDAALHAALQAAAATLPRTRALGVEIAYDSGRPSRIDAIVGARGRDGEHEAIRRWLDTRPFQAIAASRTGSEAGRPLVHAILSALEGSGGHYKQLWFEADGRLAGSSPRFAPAVLCEHRPGGDVSGFSLPFGEALAAAAPALVETMQRVPHADSATMLGWMPGRTLAGAGLREYASDEKSCDDGAAGRLYWARTTVRSLVNRGPDPLRRWRLPAALCELLIDAEASGFDYAVAVNVKAGGWMVDGVEFMPIDREQPEQWRRFDAWSRRAIPSSMHWGYSFGEIFEHREEGAVDWLPDHLLGAGVALPASEQFASFARPSHIKLSIVRDRESSEALRLKVYGGLDHRLISSGG